MVKITKCLNDWNATVEALGQGMQSILIRKNSTTLKEFLLYPTVSYANKDNYLDSFKDSMQDFVKENILPAADGKAYEVKYYAKVEEVFESQVSRIGKFNIIISGLKSMFQDISTHQKLTYGYLEFMN